MVFNFQLQNKKTEEKERNHKCALISILLKKINAQKENGKLLFFIYHVLKISFLYLTNTSNCLSVSRKGKLNSLRSIFRFYTSVLQTKTRTIQRTWSGVFMFHG